MDANIQKYQALLSTVEFGSFTKAARALSYSQSGISRMIADLERDWNVTLLERSKGGVRPTSEGLKLLPYVRSTCEEHRKLQMQVDAIRGIDSGLIRIGTFSSVSTHWLPNIISAFQHDYPNIDYDLIQGDYAEIEQWIIDGHVDCGFLRAPTHPGLETTFLEQDPLYAVLPENHVLAQCDCVPVRKLIEEPFLLVDKRERGEISEVSDFFEQYNLKPNVRCTTWDDYAIMAMVECGLGVSILPALILNRVSYRIAVRPLDMPAFRRICFAVRDSASASRAVKKFMEYLDCRQG